MLISKMNRFIEKHGTASLIILALAFVIPLILWQPGRGFGSGRNMGGSKYVGKMYGKKLRRDTLNRSIYAVELPMFLMSGKWMHEEGDRFEMLRNAALDRMRFLHEAKRIGLDKTVTDDEVNDRLRIMFSIPNKGFQEKYYNGFVTKVLPRIHFDEKTFVQTIRESLIIEKLRQDILDKVTVTDAETDVENRKQLATYSVDQAVFKSSDYLSTVELVSQADVKKYFEANKGTLRLPDSRSVSYAVFSKDQFAASVSVDAATVKAYYDARKDSYDGKPFTAVKDEIITSLKGQKAMTKAYQAALTFAESLKGSQQEPAAGHVAETFKQACEAAKVAMKTTSAFTKYAGTIAGFPDGTSERLKEAALSLSPSAPYSAARFAGGQYFVLALTDVTPGKEADALTPALTAVIKEDLQTAIAKDYYTANIVPFQPLLKGQATIYDFIRLINAGGLKGQLPAVVKGVTPDELRQFVRTKVAPFFKPTKKQALVAIFKADDYLDKIGPVSDADIQAAFAKNKAQYGRQVKASHILLGTKDMDAKQKAAAKAKLIDIRQQIEAGKDFADMARKYSTGPTAPKGGELGFFTRGRLVKPFEDAAFALKKGELSDVVETQFGYHLIKVMDIKPEKSLDDVKGELISKVKNQKAFALAQAAAEDFDYDAFNSVSRSHDPESEDNKKAPTELFAAFAKSKNVKVEWTRWFQSQSFTPPFGADWKAVGEAFKVSKEDPVSPVIPGNSTVYVVCWAGTDEGRLPDFDTHAPTVEKVVSIIRKDKATELAREGAKAAATAISAKLKDGADLKAAAGKIAFTDIADFSLSEPPSDPNSALIVETVTAMKAGALSPALKTLDGALLIYLDKKQPVSDKVLAEKRESAKSRLLKQRQQAKMADYTAKLEADSMTELKK